MAELEEPDRSRDLRPAILLVDMDSFFASVEIRDDPSLHGKPVLVGGDGRRGVVASCSYEARRFGIHSAMAMLTAKRLCPEAIVLPGNFSRYSAVSRELRSILLDATPLVEPLGLDEAFLDVTGSIALLGSPREIGSTIRRRVHDELSLDCAVGVGPSKLVAKLASRDAKPTITGGNVVPGAGVVVVMSDEVRDYLDPMDVRSLFGVGPATASALARIGIERVSELAAVDPAMLVRQVGQGQAYTLVALAQGIDPRPVVPDQAAKSVGHEETFSEDVSELDVLLKQLRRQAVAVSSALRDSKHRARTISVKIKYASFTMTSRSHTLSTGIDDHEAVLAVAAALLSTIELGEGVRLMGLIASGLEAANVPVQLRLDVGVGDELADAAALAEQLQLDRSSLDEAIDEIRSRFGRDSLGAASMLRSGGLRMPSQREAPFGPSDQTPGSKESHVP